MTLLEASKSVTQASVTCVVSVRVCQRGSHWTTWTEIWHRELLWKSVDEIQIWLQPAQILDTLPEELGKFYFVSEIKSS